MLNWRGDDALIGRPAGSIAHKQFVAPQRRGHTAAALPIAASKRHILVDIEQQVQRRLLRENLVTIERRINAHAMISAINQMPSRLPRLLLNNRQATEFSHRIFHRYDHTQTQSSNIIEHTQNVA